MLIALDHDGTYDKDPEMWEVFIRLCKMRGHEIVMVTMRHEHEPVRTTSCFVYYTGRRAKKPWCEAHSLHVDIWIDDQPHWLYRDG